MAHVLVIDDELPIRKLLRGVLEGAGHTVCDAPDGRTGMAVWRQEPVDVVVTDIFMPEKDGVELLIELKHVEVRPKIIVMSGGMSMSMSWLKEAIYLLGADRILMKPFEPQTLVSTIQEVLDCHA